MLSVCTVVEYFTPQSIEIVIKKSYNVDYRLWVLSTVFILKEVGPKDNCDLSTTVKCQGLSVIMISALRENCSSRASSALSLWGSDAFRPVMFTDMSACSHKSVLWRSGWGQPINREMVVTEFIISALTDCCRSGVSRAHLLQFSLPLMSNFPSKWNHFLIDANFNLRKCFVVIHGGHKIVL